MKLTVITLQNSFHGRTITTLAATGQDKFHDYFFPFTEGFRYADANNLNSVDGGYELSKGDVYEFMLCYNADDNTYYAMTISKAT